MYNLAMATSAVEKTIQSLGLTLFSLVLLVGVKGFALSMVGNESAVKAMQEVVCFPVVIAGALGMIYLLGRGDRKSSI